MNKRYNTAALLRYADARDALQPAQAAEPMQNAAGTRSTRQALLDDLERRPPVGLGKPGVPPAYDLGYEVMGQWDGKPARLRLCKAQFIGDSQSWLYAFRLPTGKLGWITEERLRALEAGEPPPQTKAAEKPPPPPNDIGSVTAIPGGFHWHGWCGTKGFGSLPLHIH